MKYKTRFRQFNTFGLLLMVVVLVSGCVNGPSTSEWGKVGNGERGVSYRAKYNLPYSCYLEFRNDNPDSITFNYFWDTRKDAVRPDNPDDNVRAGKLTLRGGATETVRMTGYEGERWWLWTWGFQKPFLSE